MVDQRQQQEGQSPGAEKSDEHRSLALCSGGRAVRHTQENQESPCLATFMSQGRRKKPKPGENSALPLFLRGKWSKSKMGG